jgi:DNA-binding beta-propeller fold protein YncE
MLLSRRAFLTVPALAACTRRTSGGYRGYAFVANQEGQSLAVIDLEVMAVARHIAIEGSPAQVVASASKPMIYALTPETASVHEVQFDRLNVSRKLAVASAAVSMALSPDERTMFVLARQPRGLIALDLDRFQASWNVSLPQDPLELALSADGKTAAVTTARGVWLVDLAARRLRGPVLEGDFGSAQFCVDEGKLLVAANRGAHLLSLIDTASGRLVTHLPLPIRPDHLCITQDGGQLFVTGEGMDGVVIVYPYQTEIAETVLAGHAPGAMAVSDSLLFVASPQSGDVNILEIDSRKVIAVVPVGADPGAVLVTPDNRYALVLNRKSGDVAVLRASTAATKRFRWTLLTLIPVGERPVSAAVRGV